jgi:hypothetical protein
MAVSSVALLKSLTFGLALLLGLSPLANVAAAESKELKPAHTWTASVDDEALEAKGSKGNVISDAKTWDHLRADWKLPDKTKGVDFKKHLVLVGTTRGSRIGGKAMLADDGDLKFAPISTRDLRAGFRYLIVVVPREGVKSVNGKAVE